MVVVARIPKKHSGSGMLALMKSEAYLKVVL